MSHLAYRTLVSWWQEQKFLPSFLSPVLSMACIYKRLYSDTSPTTHTPLIWNSLFLEGATPFHAAAGRMYHPQLFTAWVPESDCLGF